MPKRQAVAEFLLGFFAFPVCALFGVMEAVLFHWTHAKAMLCVAFFALFPLAGAIKTRQKSLIAGQITGLIATILFYLAVKPS
ncbi:hypothetical protein CCAX7_31290 [Capsulimonas corticalis]|uniref:Uncharacterized protein n=1 Tax=Capsulimonas corticalis TaxID=2219043 RepID=A0A402CSH6_9BACT|nr:hypothetical protein [Capsulimonas corticalis]BDI31078.1 hypothetical protein CCAX7_31290 [Capsulimonas corticalis]